MARRRGNRSDDRTYGRRRADVVGAVAAGSTFAVCAVVAAGGVSAVERSLFRGVNELPSWLYRFLWLVMQVGSLGAVFVVAAVALVWRRNRMGVELAVAGLAAYWLAIVFKNVVDRGRPTAFLADVVIRGSRATGLGFPSGHAAVSCALAATAVPFLAVSWRRVVWLAPALVGVARVYVGAHFPLDVAGGWALGYTVAAVVHLVLGSPSPRTG
jgi:undecaprenyl-diphosphatase